MTGFVSWAVWRLRLGWARHTEGHRYWLARQVGRHPAANRRVWEDDVALMWWKAEMATISRRRLELNNPLYQGVGR